MSYAHRCKQPKTNYPEFSCGSVATFRIRFVREGSGKEVLTNTVCAQHLSKACRTAFEHLHPDYYSVQVVDLREGK